jgi:hypothetical protein
MGEKEIFAVGCLFILEDISFSFLFSLLFSRPQANCGVSTATEEPGLMRMEHTVENSNIIFCFVASQNLQRNDHRIREEIVVDGCMEDVNCEVVAH